MLPLLGVDMAIGGSLRGAGDTRFPLMTSFLGSDRRALRIGGNVRRVSPAGDLGV